MVLVVSLDAVVFPSKELVRNFENSYGLTICRLLKEGMESIAKGIFAQLQLQA